MFTLPYQIIKNRLASQIPELNQVDWELGQSHQSQKLLFTSPAAFIAFDPVNTITQGQNIQNGRATVRIRLATSSITGDDERIRKLNPDDHMVLVDEIFQALQDYGANLSALSQYSDLKGTNQDYHVFNSLQRTRITPDHRSTSVMVTEQSFEALFYDTSSIRKYIKTTPDATITKDII